MPLKGRVLNGKVAVITGCGRGVGRAIAIKLAKEGADIAAFDILKNITILPYKLSSIHQIETLIDEIRAIGSHVISMNVNVAKGNDVKSAIKTVKKKFGKIDILVNNAGVMTVAPVTKLTEDEWDTVFNINAKGVFLCSKYVLPYMIQQRGGKIINIASIAGKVGMPFAAHYSASKAAIIGFTMSLAVEVARFNIQSNAICPTAIRTPMFEKLTPKLAKVMEAPEKEFIKKTAEVPLGEVKPEDVANLVSFLASPASNMITGQAINICGGRDTPA